MEIIIILNSSFILNKIFHITESNIVIIDIIAFSRKDTALVMTNTH